ncbi:hypothetical protein [Chitinophaga silvisoli]|uniref:DUF4251 domain-containing protein n=1 Tax=Chitinophaga silvisoli TaxID=2291814 RepID=A0A3E1NWK0_9BACT|nr:hypothetical protein [Chitinophaga silvisoli]RFM32148.1 hypothetical protein DXN04_25530 [Chitinophaga silvisoli]
MKRLLIIMSCVLLIACGSSNSKTASTEKAPVAPLSLSEKVFKIAEALPLSKDSATNFLTGLFIPGDSMKVTMDGDFKHFTGKDFSLVIYNPDSSVERVEMWPAHGTSLNIPLKELEVKLDSAWQEYNMRLEIKEPPPGVMGWYTDQQHRKKKIEVMGPVISDLAQNQEIREIRVVANDF